jgi:hypothetical protein
MNPRKHVLHHRHPAQKIHTENISRNPITGKMEKLVVLPKGIQPICLKLQILLQT